MARPLYPELPLLMVDDEPAWLNSLSTTLLQSKGINNVVHCTDSLKVLSLLEQREFDLVLLDLTMPHLSGRDLLAKIKEQFPELPVIVISGMNQLETAVDCMKLGSFDYFVKIDEQDRLVAGVCRALEYRKLQKENLQLVNSLLGGELKNPEVFAEIITCSEQMYSMFRYLEVIAPSKEPILICGESGVGKELVARAIHRLSRPEQPWVAVNVAGLDDTVFSDTLFGHKRGAFTGADSDRQGMIAAAGEGVLFLDEIGDLSLASQVKLLRLLQEQEYFPLGSDQPSKTRARIVVATNLDLAKQESLGLFRRDLIYRLSTHRVQIVPLKDRPKDLPLLLDYFLAEAAQSLGKNTPSYPKELPILLATYSFPGNIRELRSMIYGALSLHTSGILSMTSFKKVLQGENYAAEQGGMASPISQGEAIIFPEKLPLLREVGNLLVREALKRTQENQSLAAEMLGVTRQALGKRLRKL